MGTEGYDEKSPIETDHAESADGQGKRREDIELQHLGYNPELIRTRSLYTLLFQSLAIIAVPFGEGTALLSAVVGGGQLAYFVGWIVVSILDQCIAMSLAELASRYPTSAGPYYWSFQLSKGRGREALSFFTGWVSCLRHLVDRNHADSPAGVSYWCKAPVSHLPWTFQLTKCRTGQ